MVVKDNKIVIFIEILCYNTNETDFGAVSLKTDIFVSEDVCFFVALLPFYDRI